jgi:hypothetical protein
MSVPSEAAPGMRSLEDAITRRIAKRTGGSVHDVEVVADVGRVEIRGRAECYYHKQLVVEAALAEVWARKDMAPMKIDLKIVVDSSRPEIELP